MHPAVQRDVIDGDAAFGEEFFEISVREPEAQIPAHRQHDHLRREAKPSERGGQLHGLRYTMTTFHQSNLAVSTRSVNATEPVHFMIIGPDVTSNAAGGMPAWSYAATAADQDH